MGGVTPKSNVEGINTLRSALDLKFPIFKITKWCCSYVYVHIPRFSIESQGYTEDQDKEKRQRIPGSLMKGGIPRNSCLTKWRRR